MLRQVFFFSDTALCLFSSFHHAGVDMAETAEKLANYDDLLKVPEYLVAEIIQGQLYATPDPHPNTH